MSNTTSLRQVINNPKYVKQILPLVFDRRHNVDAWDGNAPEDFLAEMRLSRPRMNHIHPHIKAFFEPYYERFNQQYRFVRDVINHLPNIIDEIKETKEANRQAQIVRLEAQKAAIDKQIKELKANATTNTAIMLDTADIVKPKPLDMSTKQSAKDEQSLDLENDRNRGYKFAKIFMNLPAPPKPQPLVRYVDTVDYAIKQILNKDEFNEHSKNRVFEFMDKLYKEPFNTRINIKEYNNSELNLLSNYLYDWFNEVILPKMNDKMLIVYEIDGMKTIKHPVQKDANRIIEMFKNNKFFDIDKSYTSINAYDESIYLNMFDRIYFQDISGNVERPDNRRSVHGDGFFPRKLNGNYKLLEPYLECCQIYASYTKDGNTKESVNVPCFIYALEQAGVDKEKLKEILAMVGFQKRINRTQWTDIANAFNLHIHLRIVDSKGNIDNANKNNKGWYGNANGAEVYLAEYLDHVFIDKVLPITSFAIKNLDELIQLTDDMNRIINTAQIKNGKPSIDKKRANIRTLEAILAIDRANGFTTIHGGDDDVIQANVFGYEIQEPAPIATPYNKSLHTRQMVAPKFKAKEQPTTASIYYADFETCKKTVTDKKNVSAQAIPFMLCVQGVIETHDEAIPVSRTYTGFDCMDQMLNDDAIVNGSIIYFHNLGFDGNFLMKYAAKKMIKKGNKIMQIPIKYNGKTITLKDSYSLFPKKLSAFPASFPKAFEGTNIQKEYFPYDYYTYDRINASLNGTDKIGNFTECCKELNLSDSDKRQFAHNLTSISDCIDTKTKQFDMLKYCRFYCMQDVRVLRIGFNAFAAAAREEPINLNVHNFLTLPSLADYYMKKHVFYKNGKCFELNGPVQKFIQQAVYGGRCMTANNKRYTINKPLYDFDARSLYPSAMNRMFVVQGVPEYYENPSPDAIYNKANLPDILKYAFLDKQERKDPYRYYSQFVVEIEITNVGIHRAFPLIVKREKNMQSNVNECVKMVVDMITLQDLIEFQDISFKLGNGYVWTGSRDYTVQKVIKRLYDLRNEYKKTGNPTQEVIKLIMNSAYGKSIQKPIKSFLQFIKPDEFEFFVRDRYHQIIELTELDNGVHLFELAKQKSVQFNNVLFGVTVLSMSKRIMNEVMCLAEDNNINIYYQDTDSMHIEADKLTQLADAFEAKYNRKLIGDAMGQFHDDFDELNNNPRAIVHISAGKKMYYDKLINDNGEIAEHYRLKGIPQECIKNTANKRYNGNIQALYEALYNGDSIEFDLLDGKVCMVMDRRGHVNYRASFNRAVKATSQL